MNYKATLEQIAEDAKGIRIPANRFFHRHFLVHEAGKVKEKRQKKESAVTRKRRGGREKQQSISFLFCPFYFVSVSFRTCITHRLSTYITTWNTGSQHGLTFNTDRRQIREQHGNRYNFCQ